MKKQNCVWVVQHYYMDGVWHNGRAFRTRDEARFHAGQFTGKMRIRKYIPEKP